MGRDSTHARFARAVPGANPGGPLKESAGPKASESGARPADVTVAQAARAAEQLNRKRAEVTAILPKGRWFERSNRWPFFIFGGRWAARTSRRNEVTELTEECALSQKIPVFDHTGSRVLFREKRARVMELVGAGVLFILSATPLEAAFVHAPVSSDASATLGPNVAIRAADGSRRCGEIVRSRRSITMRFRKDGEEVVRNHSFIPSPAVPHEFAMRTHDGALLYMPHTGQQTKGKR